MTDGVVNPWLLTLQTADFPEVTIPVPFDHRLVSTMDDPRLHLEGKSPVIGRTIDDDTREKQKDHEVKQMANE